MNIIEMEANLELRLRTSLGEGAIWHYREQRLYWVDIKRKSLHIYDPLNNSDIELAVGSKIGTVVPAEHGGAVVALQTGIHKIDTKTGKLQWLLNPLPDTEQLRYNDGKCDPSGRLWVGTLAMDGRKNGAVLWRIDGNLTAHLILDGIGVSNGIVWTKDRTKMFYADTPTGMIQVFDYDDATGNISNRKIAVTIPNGLGQPDGMAIDENDDLWVALWGGGCVCQFNSRSGELMRKIVVPAPHVTSCAFGGSNLDILYITTASGFLTPEQSTKYPLSGSLFSVKPGVKGVNASFFRDKIKP